MKIGLNLLYMLPGQVGGSETYATELINGYEKNAPEVDFVVFVNLEASHFPLPSNSRFTRVVCNVRATNRIKRYFYEQFVLPFLALRYHLDVLHSLGYVGPILHFQRHLLSILDANFIRLSWSMSPLKRWVYARVARLCARTCTHITTISNFSKEELIECLPVTGEKITVVHLGAPSVTFSIKPEAVTSGAARPYLLVLGGGSPHKNIRAFVQAFTQASARIPHGLVIAGRLTEPLDDLPDALALVRGGRITITGFLSANDLDAAYRGADVFVFPTLYEGFGLPVLEAQIRGIPVLCSNVASLPEIGGDSVAYFDPRSISNMAKTLEELLAEPTKVTELRERGYKNVLRYSWENTCQKTLALCGYRGTFGPTGKP
ncbi:MAG: glycosyltransferase family 1 protein [Holophaga sp.]|nr:glycosyltransferase family 1 protein [Holophaga sp.]